MLRTREHLEGVDARRLLAANTVEDSETHHREGDRAKEKRLAERRDVLAEACIGRMFILAMFKAWQEKGTRRRGQLGTAGIEKRGRPHRLKYEHGHRAVAVVVSLLKLKLWS